MRFNNSVTYILKVTFKETLPYDLAPTFRGQFARYTYKLTIGVQKLHRNTQLLRLPFKVYSLFGNFIVISVYFLLLTLKKMQQQQQQQKNRFGKICVKKRNQLNDQKRLVVFHRRIVTEQFIGQTHSNRQKSV